MWNKRGIPTEPGSYTALRPAVSETYIQINTSDYHLLDISYDVEVIQKLYLGNLPLLKIQGLNDEIRGGIILPRESEIITDWIDTIAVERTWQIIPSIDSLAVKPMLVLEAQDHYSAEESFRK